MNTIPSRYNPKDTEDKWYALWQGRGLFRACPDKSKKPFSIVIPPPNVTGILHMGHALNNAIQDILIRYHRMKGHESLWMPGTDHAGIATQNVVEKAMAKEGLRRNDLGREKFIERVWQWKEQYGSAIIKQLKKLGASCDWQRVRFTMDAEYSKAVVEVFVRLFEKGLIYQGSYIINWCPRCQTALSDEEAPHHELQGNLYYLKYPYKSDPSKFVVVATTRPETMLGDTAVAVNPKDKRYKKAIGETLVLPLVNREIPIIADEMIDMKFGTGAVKVTPAHDPNDYLMGKKHRLEFVNVMSPNGKMNEQAGDYNGMDRFEARQVILEDLKEQGLLEKTEPHPLSAGHCYRCHTIIEPYLSKQWFVKMKPLAKPAIEAVKKGKIKFYPKRWTKVYLGWMENIQDWCISRQIWWGHRIPVYYCRKCLDSGNSQISNAKSQINSKLQNTKQAQGVIVSRAKPDKCPKCGSADIYQDEDVLDTWFSSWLWPFATFYWPPEAQSPELRARTEADLKYFYPTSTLVTAPEIIFFWVARMIMAGLEFMQEVPFKDVYIHGTVRDVEGKKMSKSLGNIIDPLEIIDEYGADALRFSLISITSQGQDVYLSKERFEQGRNFANKIWNASRLILMNLDPGQARADLCVFFKKEPLGVVNRWILSRFYSTLKEVQRGFSEYRFNEAANLLYSFFWHEFCDWYLEVIKADIRNTHNQVVMYKVLEKFLRALHPFMPFITEEIWHLLPGATDSIMCQSWPHIQEQVIDKKLEKEAESLFSVVTQIRNLRAQIGIALDKKVVVSVYPHTASKKKLVEEYASLVVNMAKLEALHSLSRNKRPARAISSVAEDVDIYLHSEGIVDADQEKEKLTLKIQELHKLKQAKEARLKNHDFMERAPAGVVEKEKAGLDELSGTLTRLEKMSKELT
ncbi:MAG: valine--tRNA ligase [Candidatus Omnitrophota bacterium]|nr:MAG: valine--tRNA ligase [Candidatus Omnitrophota bacterium]